MGGLWGNGRYKCLMTRDIRDLSADFYLRLNEGAGEPRACWRKGWVRYAGRDDLMLVAIEPPVEDIYHPRNGS